MSPRLKKTLKTLLVIVLIAAFFFYIPIGEIYRAVLSANLTLFGLAVLLSFPGIFLSTLSTWLLARRQEIVIPLRDFFVFNLAIRFYSYFSPASAIATAMRWHKLSAGSKGAEALSAIALTRAMSIFAALVMGVIWVLIDINQELINPIVLFLFVSLMFAGWLVFTRLSPILAGLFARWSANLSNPGMKRITSFLGRFFRSMEVYTSMPTSALLMVGSINFGNELLGVLIYFFIAYAIGLPVSFVNLGWLRSLSFLSALTPLTLAGGVGLREVTIMVVLSTLNIEPNLAAAFTFLNYARGVVFALFCGMIEFLLLLKKDENLPAQR